MLDDVSSHKEILLQHHGGSYPICDGVEAVDELLEGFTLQQDGPGWGVHKHFPVDLSHVIGYHFRCPTKKEWAVTGNY